MSLIKHIDTSVLTDTMVYRLECLDDALFDSTVLVYCGVRTVQEQNMLYRRSHKIADIHKKINHFEELGRADLAIALADTPPQPTMKAVTNAAGGESWHNYGCAVDCVPMLGGKALWSYRDYREEWELFGNSAEDVGLEWAGSWTGFKEYAHVQSGKGNPLLQDMEPVWTL